MTAGNSDLFNPPKPRDPRTRSFCKGCRKLMRMAKGRVGEQVGWWCAKCAPQLDAHRDARAAGLADE